MLICLALTVKWKCLILLRHWQKSLTNFLNNEQFLFLFLQAVKENGLEMQIFRILQE